MHAVGDQSRPPLREQVEEPRAHEGHCAVAQKLPRFIYREMADGARFENPTASETIGPDLPSSFHSQSFTAESEAGEKLVKTDRTR